MSFFLRALFVCLALTFLHPTSAADLRTGTGSNLAKFLSSLSPQDVEFLQKYLQTHPNTPGRTDPLTEAADRPQTQPILPAQIQTFQAVSRCQTPDLDERQVAALQTGGTANLQGHQKKLLAECISSNDAGVRPPIALQPISAIPLETRAVSARSRNPKRTQPIQLPFGTAEKKGTIQSGGAASQINALLVSNCFDSIRGPFPHPNLPNGYYLDACGQPIQGEYFNILGLPPPSVRQPRPQPQVQLPISAQGGQPRLPPTKLLQLVGSQQPPQQPRIPKIPIPVPVKEVVTTPPIVATTWDDSVQVDPLSLLP